MSSSYDDIPDLETPFEFERKFFVKRLPAEVRQHGARNIIIQAYIFAEAGYAVRVRISFDGVDIPDIADMPVLPFNEHTDYMGAYERKILAVLVDLVEMQEKQAQHQGDSSRGLAQADAELGLRMTATIAVKSPPVTGERYELEHELDRDVAVQILRRSSRLVLKTRYSLWYGEDGWEFDVFEGQNRGLIVAECERLGPVVDLKVPTFCETELTGDLRFTNDYLSKEPWIQWEYEYMSELAARGPYFLDLKS